MCAKDAYRSFVGKPEGKRTLGRLGRRWRGNIKLDIKGIELDCVNWICLIQDIDR